MTNKYSDIEIRDSRIALITSISAKLTFTVGIVLAQFISNTIGFFGLPIFCLFWLVGFSLEVAGLVYGLPSIRTKCGRLAIGLSGVGLIFALVLIKIISLQVFPR